MFRKSVVWSNPWTLPVMLLLSVEVKFENVAWRDGGEVTGAAVAAKANNLGFRHFQLRAFHAILQSSNVILMKNILAKAHSFLVCSFCLNMYHESYCITNDSIIIWSCKSWTLKLDSKAQRSRVGQQNRIL